MLTISMESGGRNEETSHHLLGAGGRSMTLRVTAETWEKGGNTFNNQINIISLLSCLPSSQFLFSFSGHSLTLRLHNRHNVKGSTPQGPTPGGPRMERPCCRAGHDMQGGAEPVRVEDRRRVG